MGVTLHHTYKLMRLETYPFVFIKQRRKWLRF